MAQIIAYPGTETEGSIADQVDQVADLETAAVEAWNIARAATRRAEQAQQRANVALGALLLDIAAQSAPECGAVPDWRE